MRRRMVAGGVVLATLLCGAQEPASHPSTQQLRDGAAETAQGDLSAAMANTQSAIALHPQDAAGWYQLGSLLGQTGDFAGAEASFRHAIQLQPGMAKAHYNLALTLIGNPQNKEDWPGAIAECREAMKIQPDYPDALNLLGAGLNQLAQPDAAIEALRHALQLAPAFPQAHFNLGLALESKGQLDDAAREYQAAVTGRGEYPEASSSLGKLLFRTGKASEAEQPVERALRANPDLPDAHYTHARILHSLHREQQAAVEFAIAKDLMQRQADGIQSSQMSNQGLQLASKGDMAAAATALRGAIALKPDYGVPHFNLGLILADMGQTAGAIHELSKAVSLLPGQAAPWFELGRVLSVAKDDLGALKAVAWAAHLAPSNAVIQSELTRLRRSFPAHANSTAMEVIARPGIGAAVETAAAHFDFAGQLSARGDWEGAVGELLRSLALQPDMRQARLKLAAAYSSLGQNNRAILEYRKLLLASPDDAAARVALEEILQSPDTGP